MMSTLAETLIEKGLAPNAFYLSINSNIGVPHGFELTGTWSLPSRLFRFPLHHTGGDIFIRHALLDEHPFVLHAEKALGRRIGYGSGLNLCRQAAWVHAVDLATAHRLDDLITTADFSDDKAIMCALAFAMRCDSFEDAGPISTKDARATLKTLGIPNPGRDNKALRALDRPSQLQSDTGAPHLPVNGLHGPEAVWITIHALEDGYFINSRGHLEWTQAGIDFYNGETFGLLI